jgi:hypothetical protein
MNAQDIWNLYRHNKYQLDDMIKNTILEMKREKSNILAGDMGSSGSFGMEMLLLRSYNELQYDLCYFLLENGAELNRVTFIKNPGFTKFNQLLENYQVQNPEKRVFYKELLNKISQYSEMEYIK